MSKIIAGLLVTIGTLGYITWFVEDILRVPNDKKLLTLSRKAASSLWYGSKDAAIQVQAIRKANKAERIANQRIPSLNRVVLVKTNDPKVERDTKGRSYAVNGTLWD